MLGSQTWSPPQFPDPSLCGGNDRWKPPCTNQVTGIDSNKAKYPTGALGGHANWMLTTYEGRVFWFDHSYYLLDDDYNFTFAIDRRYSVAQNSSTCCFNFGKRFNTTALESAEGDTLLAPLTVLLLGWLVARQARQPLVECRRRSGRRSAHLGSGRCHGWAQHDRRVLSRPEQPSLDELVVRRAKRPNRQCKQCQDWILPRISAQPG
jgi:hypothetical protein